jgi:hypothetical protein
MLFCISLLTMKLGVAFGTVYGVMRKEPVPDGEGGDRKALPVANPDLLKFQFVILQKPPYSIHQSNISWCILF